MNKMKHIITLSLVLLLSIGLYLPIVAYAGGPGFEDDVKTWKKGKGNGKDDDDRGDDDRGDDDWNDDDAHEIPLDGGLSLLAVAGAAYGVKRIRDNRKDNKKDDGTKA